MLARIYFRVGQNIGPLLGRMHFIRLVFWSVCCEFFFVATGIIFLDHKIVPFEGGLFFLGGTVIFPRLPPARCPPWVGLLIALLFGGQHTSAITSTWTSLLLFNEKVRPPRGGGGLLCAGSFLRFSNQSMIPINDQ